MDNTWIGRVEPNSISFSFFEHQLCKAFLVYLHQLYRVVQGVEGVALRGWGRGGSSCRHYYQLSHRSRSINFPVHKLAHVMEIHSYDASIDHPGHSGKFIALAWIYELESLGIHGESHQSSQVVLGSIPNDGQMLLLPQQGCNRGHGLCGFALVPPHRGGRSLRLCMKSNG